MQVREDDPHQVYLSDEGKGTNAYWGEGFSDIIGLTVRTCHVLR